MMLRRVASARSAAAWRSSLRARTLRPCIRPSEATITMLAQREQGLNAAPWKVSSQQHLHIRLFSSAPAPKETDQTAAVAASDDVDRESILAAFRPLCSALYAENRASTTADAVLSQWAAQTELLQRNPRPQTVQQLQRAYQEGLAILLKQREFASAQQLLAQMAQLRVPVDATISAYRIRAVALEWVTQPPPLSLAHLRELDLGANWEPTLLALVRSEQSPHHLKSPLERERFHEQLRSGVRRVLDEYEAAVAPAQLEIGPYNEALRVFASNRVPFADMVRVLSELPPALRARAPLTVDTFVALLQGARGADIRSSVDRLVKSTVLRRLHADASARSAVIARVWDQALRAVCNSYSERVMAKQVAPLRDGVHELEAVLEAVETQLRSALPDQRFATVAQHDAVFSLRVKTAALLGRPRQVHALLDEYVVLMPAGGQPDKRVILKALELFPSIGLGRVAARHVTRVQDHKDVTLSPEVVEAQQALDDVQAAIAALKMQRQGMDIASASGHEAGKSLRKLHQRVTKLKAKLRDVVAKRATVVAHLHRVQAADRSVDRVLARLAIEGEPLQDLEVALALMQQFMTTANRFAPHMQAHTRQFMADAVMDRVFDLLDVALGDEPVAEEQREQAAQLLALAAKTATLFWREQDLVDVLRIKKKVLPAEKLTADDYDPLVFLRAQQLDVSGAYGLLQEMHNAGVAPTPTTIHRIVTATLLRLFRPKEQRPTSLLHRAEEAMDSAVLEWSAAEDQNDASEDEDGVAQAWSSHPRRLNDLPSFIQEWYNLHRVKPMARTVVPVLARLLAANKVWEVRRFLQILDSMDGGLSPVTEFWLERRLEAVGKTVQDLR